MCFHANKYCSMTYNEHSCIKIEVRGARGGNTIPIFRKDENITYKKSSLTSQQSEQVLI